MNLQSIIHTLTIRPQRLKPVLLALGLTGLGLYRLLYATGVDGRGLLKSGHPAWVILCLLSVAAGILALCSTLRIRGAGGRLLRSLPAGFACVAMALSSLFTGLADLVGGYSMYALPSLLAAAAFLAVAACRILGRRSNFLLHVVICIHFALQMLKLYQANSVDPQLQNYLFQLLSCIALTVTGYQLAAFDLGQGHRRWLWLSSLSAVYLCAVSLGSSHTCFYLTGCIWALTAIPMARRSARKPAQT